MNNERLSKTLNFFDKAFNVKNTLGAFNKALDPHNNAVDMHKDIVRAIEEGMNMALRIWLIIILEVPALVYGYTLLFR